LRNKYRAKPTVCRQGHKHASKREARRCDELHLLQRAGHISDLEIEPQFWFVIHHKQLKHANGRRCGYKPDFAYTENGKQIVEDTKGFRVRDFALREALFRHLFPTYELRVIK
jgi:hypothetical protein